MLWKIINPIQIFLIVLWTLIWSTLALVFGALTFSPFIPHLIARFTWSPFILLICGVRVHVEGREYLDTSQPMVYVANHESHMDIPAFFVSIPVNLHFIAKQELKRIPVFGWSMLVGGMIFIDRSNKEKAQRSIQAAALKIAGGKSVISFPEGTRTKTGKIGMFKRGSFVLAKQAKVPVVPMAIEGSREIIRSGSYSIRPGLIKIRVLPPVHPADVEDISVEEWANNTREHVSNAVQELTT